MDLSFSINFNFGKNKKSDDLKSKSDRKQGNSNDESNLEKWLDTAQKLVKSIRVN